MDGRRLSWRWVWNVGALEITKNGGYLMEDVSVEAEAKIRVIVLTLNVLAGILKSSKPEADLLHSANFASPLEDVFRDKLITRGVPHADCAGGRKCLHLAVFFETYGH
jgi:hypothetical protein